MKTTVAVLLTMVSLSSLASTKVVGCYKRVYTAAHMKQNPDQKLKEIKFTLYSYEGNLGGIVEGTTRKPQLRESVFEATGHCEGTVTPVRGMKYDCGVDADGGSYSVEVSKDGASALLRVGVNGMRLEGDMIDDEPSENSVYLAGNKTNGVYRLSRVSASQCPLNFQE